MAQTASQNPPFVPAVTVIIPFHRVTPYLRPAVRSILNQTWRDLELFLVDNGTGAGLSALAEDGRDDRIRLISRPANEGVSAAIDIALSQSRSEYFAIMAYDDISLPLRIEKQAERLRTERSWGLVSTGAHKIDEQGRITGRLFALTSAQEQLVFSNYDHPSPTPTWMGRREVFERFAFRSQFEPAEDYDFLTRVIEKHPIGGIPDRLLHYRIHPGQASQELRNAQVLKACLVRLLTARRRSGRPENLMSAISNVGDWMTTPPDRPAIYGRFADWCLEERFPLLAAYFARKLLSVQRDCQSTRKAARVFLRALRSAPGRRVLLARLFFTGPLRTYRLRPH